MWRARTRTRARLSRGGEAEGYEAMKLAQAVLFLLLATTLEVSGDAVVRKGLYEWVGLPRLGLMTLGAALLFGYGVSVNLAPFEFRQVVGLYIATLFIVWRIGNVIAFRTWPTVPIVIGGALIVAGGVIVTFWPDPDAPGVGR